MDASWLRLVAALRGDDKREIDGDKDRYRAIKADYCDMIGAMSRTLEDVRSGRAPRPALGRTNPTPEEWDDMNWRDAQRVA